jgi:hypothetical protein
VAKSVLNEPFRLALWNLLAGKRRIGALNGGLHEVSLFYWPQVPPAACSPEPDGGLDKFVRAEVYPLTIKALDQCRCLHQMSGTIVTC